MDYYKQQPKHQKQQKKTEEKEKEGQHNVISLHNQLLCLLQQQVAIEERLVAQRALMQRITEGFAVLRGWATHNAHHHFSLHDLLVLEAYGCGDMEKNHNIQYKRDRNDNDNNSSYNNNNNNNIYYNNDSDSAGGGCVLCSDCPSLSQWQEQQKEKQENDDEQRRHVHSARKSVFASFIRARVLDEGCAPPDGPTQFHSLTASSFYLLIPHLTEPLREIADLLRPDPLILSSPSLSSSSSSLLLMTSADKHGTAAEWCTRLARVLRFLELGVKHFAEVLANSELRPLLLRSLAQVGERAEGVDCGGVVLSLCRRAAELYAELRCLECGIMFSNENE